MESEVMTEAEFRQWILSRAGGAFPGAPADVIEDACAEFQEEAARQRFVEPTAQAGEIRLKKTKAFLGGVVKNAVLRVLEKRSRHPEVGLPPEAPCEAASPEADFERARLVGILHEVADCLQVLGRVVETPGRVALEDGDAASVLPWLSRFWQLKALFAAAPLRNDPIFLKSPLALMLPPVEPAFETFLGGIEEEQLPEVLEAFGVIRLAANGMLRWLQHKGVALPEDERDAIAFVLVVGDLILRAAGYALVETNLPEPRPLRAVAQDMAKKLVSRFNHLIRKLA